MSWDIHCGRTFARRYGLGLTALEAYIPELRQRIEVSPRSLIFARKIEGLKTSKTL